ncbi:MAG: YHS domain-containing protein [Candidatus Levybacteria bacterium]|nr:YHS domain-containing protein [Candidatus Levybacteria bacterium]
MKIRKETALSQNYKGKTYYFCSENCKNSFNAKPEQYLQKGKASVHGCSCCHKS